jgi:hypothetical protein
LDSVTSWGSGDFSYSLPRYIASYIIVFEFRIPQEFRIHGIWTVLKITGTNDFHQRTVT